MKTDSKSGRSSTSPHWPGGGVMRNVPNFMNFGGRNG
jgi:hypothetical protein